MNSCHTLFHFPSNVTNASFELYKQDDTSPLSFTTHPPFALGQSQAQTADSKEA